MKPAAESGSVGFYRLQRAFYALGLAVLITGSLYWGHFILVPLALSALFAFILSNPAQWLEKKGFGRVASVLLVTLGAFGLLGAVVTLATMQIKSLASEIPLYKENINRKAEPVHHLMQRIERLQSNLQEAAPTPPPTSQATRTTTTRPSSDDKPAEVVVKPPGNSSLTWLPSLAGTAAEFLVNGVLVIVLTIFMMMQRETFRDRLIRLAGRSRLSSTTRAVADAATRVGKYLLLQLCVNATLGAVIALALYLIGVPYGPLWGLLVTVLRFVPYVGYWIAGLAAISMSAAVSPGWGQPLLVLGMFLVCDLTLANVIEPLIFSHGTGVSPVALLLAAVFWGFLWGPVGLLLSTPLTVCLAVLGKHVPALEFLATLLGDDPSLDEAAKFYNRLLAHDYDEAAVILDAFATVHSPGETYDKVIVPALAQAKTDREQQDITFEEEQAVYSATHDLLNTFMQDEREDVHAKAETPEKSTVSPTADGGTVESAVAKMPPVRVIGCAVFGQADELALRMLGDAIQPAGGELIVSHPNDLLADIAKAMTAASKPPVVCLSTLSPGGMSQARALLTQVRRRFPQSRLMVGRWGQAGDTSASDKYLRSSGADDIGWTLQQTIEQLVPGKRGTAKSPSPSEAASTSPVPA